MNLSEHIQPNTDSAIWIQEQVKKLETEMDRVVEERHLLVIENRKLKFALEEISNLSIRWPLWDYQDLYQVSKDTADTALEDNRRNVK